MIIINTNKIKIIIIHQLKYIKNIKMKKNIWHGWDLNLGPFNYQASTLSTKLWSFSYNRTKKDKFEFPTIFSIFANYQNKTLKIEKYLKLSYLGFPWTNFKNL